MKEKPDLNTSLDRKKLKKLKRACSPERANTRTISVARQVVPDFHNTIAEVMIYERW